MAITVWRAGEAGQPTTVTAPGPWRLTVSGITEAAADGVAPSDAAVLLEVAEPEGAGAVLLVPDRLSGLVARRGSPLASGLHMLEHGDRLEMGSVQVWISLEGEPRAALYDPRVHGGDACCARSGARLHSGTMVVTCPGTRLRQCSALYTEEAWGLGLRCHECGYDPRTERWRPTIRAKRKWCELVDQIKHF